MNKILIINQHTCNHGDESAGIALIRKITNKYNDCQIDILYNWYGNLNPNAFIGNEDFNSIKHYHFPVNKFDKILIRLTSYLPAFAWVLSLFSRTLKKQYKLIKNYDLIINGPTGINLGPYEDWYYLWRLLIVKKLNIPLVIYSISFGPLDRVSSFFRKRTLEVLKYAKFLSLRDEKSHKYGEQYKINFHKAIDTTFLITERKGIPKEYEHLAKEEYVVIVPNELYRWHTYFKNVDKNKMDDLYIQIINSISSHHEMKVVLLPQMFSEENDKDYMLSLISDSDNSSITVIDERYDSDVQQEIIANSQFVIGARYHTIVFAINNLVPFYALSYEHKMANMLSILDLKEFSVDLLSLFEKDNNIDSVISDISSCLNQRSSNRTRIEVANKKAISIANKTFSEFEDCLKF
ncbi:polysaccharide pyruvyl transferase family protein [Galbibacter mesophilus]|uniref:polysaccharide pyruvyl transferase family protein n=1 Tax=Galbibacter mesophilus TaxID=379069 RepID=UPI00191E6485|nr:polysaccharide pyruvyl transferase family protein [Galbibacter mesophilus]MCM5663489.1 polysaccharide pyruvyl transferase family protein [Galbibacter mesophilus]